MSSPIGGFYLSAQQRQKRKLAEYDAKIVMILTLTLADGLNQEQMLMEVNEKITIGAEYKFGPEAELKFTSIQLESGLFQISFDYKQIQQTLTLGENESVSSQLADAEHIKAFLKLVKEPDY